MNFKSLFLAVTTAMVFTASVHANEAQNPMDEINPFTITEQELLEMDRNYESETGLSPYIESPFNFKSSCYQRSCDVFLQVDKSRQRAQLFVDGVAQGGEWKVTTGSAGHATPNFDRAMQEPLRAYSKYSSSKYPGGSWNGLGNMPYAVFIKGGFAVHGTTGTETSGNISKLGTVPLSHGCVRVHPHNGKIFNDLVRAAYARGGKAWITVR